MKKLLLILLTVMMGISSLTLSAQNTLTVADGTTTNSNVPIYGLWADAYLRCQTIYPAGTLDAAAVGFGMTGGTITSVTYYLSSTAAEAWTGTWEVKLMEVTDATLSAFLDMTNATSVFTGTLDATTSPLTINFTTPYTYQGGNLLIEVSQTTSGNYKSASFYGVSATGASWQGYNSSAWTSITGSAQNFMPKTTFTFTGGTEITCSPVQNIAIDATQTTSSSLTLTWADSINAGATYSVYNMADNTLIQDGITATTFTVTGLNANTEYTFGVEANCSATDASAIMTAGDRTACAALTTLPYTCGFEADELQGTTNVDRIPFCWNRYSTGTGSYTYYPYSNTSYVHNGSRALYFYTGTSTSYPDTQAVVLPELDVTVFPMSGNRITFWSRMSSTSYNAYVYVGTVSDPADFSTFTIVDSVLISGTTHTKYSVPMTNATNAYIAIMVLKSNGGYLTIDDVTIEEMPSCLEVTNLTVTGTTSSSVTLNWVDANSGATFTIYNMADTSVVGTASDNTYTVENLTANTTYTFGVQANCTSGDAPITTLTVTTDCDVFVAPYTWTFEDMTASAAPVCWNKIGSGTVNVINSTTNSHDGSKYVRFSGSTSNLVALPETQAEISTLQLRFWTRPESYTNASCGNFSVGYLTDITDASTFVEIANYVYSDFSAYTEKTVTFANAPAGARMAMRHNAGSTSWYWYIDDVTIEEAPACLPVSGLNVSNITADNATLTWSGTTNDYTIYDMTDTTVVGTATDTTYTIDNLAANTTYTFGVQSNCTSDVSPIVTITVTTSCATETMPWSENFDNWTSKSPCWSFLSGAYSGTPTPSTSAWALNSTYGTYINIVGKALTMNVYSTNRYWAVTPPITITNDNAMLSVDVAVAAWSAATPNYDTDDTLAFAITTDGGTTYTTLLVYDNTQLNSLGNDYTTIYIPVNGYNGQTVRFAIFAGSSASGGDNRIAIDNVTVGEPVSCLPVTSLAASNITTTDVTLTWQGDAAGYTIYDMADTSVLQTTTDTSVVINTLNPNTTYTFGVQANCGSDQSTIVTVTFSTACTALTLPYTETFETTSNAVGCWTVSGDGTWGIGVGDYSTSTGAYEGSYNAKITHSATGNTTMLISPVLDGVQSGLALDFAYVMRSWSGDIDELRVYSRSAADAAWQQVAEFTAEAATWTTQTVIIPGTVYQVAFEHTDNYGYGIGLDSVVFSAISGNFCYAVSNLVASNATASSVTLSWSDDNNSGATYTIYNMADNTVIATGVATTSYDVTGLTSLTGYTFGVVANCSATDESSVVTVDAVTACGGATCNITIVGNDSYGDGWNGNAIDIIQNGTTIATFTLTADSTLTETFTVCSEAPVSFSWVSGLYASETSFEIFDASDSSVYVGVGSSMTDGTFYTLNDACSATPPTPVDTLHVTLTINDATLGTITPAVGTYDLFLGDTIVFTATPNVDANFDGWRMIVGGQAIATLPLNPYSMVVNPNILSLGELTVMAIFSDSTSAPDSMTLIVNTADPTMGTTDPAPGIHNYAVGSQSIVTALPNPGYEFLYWVESATIAGMTMTDTIYNATVGLVVPPVYAGVTLNLTAYFQVSQGEPCDAPTGVSVSAFDDQSISLVWDNNANVESWNIRYRSQSSDWATLVANTNNYTITGLTPNTTYQIQVQSNCGDGSLSQWSATITQTTTGLNSYLENNISLYPNPANDYIDVRVDELNVTNMEVYDVYGKFINTVNVVNNPTRINVSGLATGMYFVRVTTEQGTVTKSFIKK